MSNFLVSSFSLSSAPRSAVFHIQDELRTAQKEVTTGRFADVGLVLGSRTNQTVSLRVERESAIRMQEANTLIGQRFNTMQTALESIAKTGENLLASLISNGPTDAGISASTQQAKAGLQQFMGAINASSGSRFLFSGAATDQPALAFEKVGGGGVADSYEDNSTARKAVADALAFAAPVTDLDAFLDGPFNDLFEVPDPSDGTGWDMWSKANAAPVYNRISDSETLDVSYPATNDAFRNIVKAYVMVSDLGLQDMGEDQRQLLASRAVETLSLGLSQLTEIRADIGSKQSRLEITNEALGARKNVLTMSISSFEDVDAYEASTRVTTLTNLLEASYALTARISRLSIMNYL
ncbi:flagellar hook-associated family protein [Aurantimonas sp. A2-1-M11]|uniref:flagellar hook-associated family protein n=1 Tax=Aurantimonas sp. A2-1-M11 TaxID=3113712 RepID=UPI002F959F6B